ncbi:ATP-binding cassette domain-containing protein [Stetteria hydrogenophila]
MTVYSVEALGLTKVYPSGVKAVDGVSFKVRRGELFSLLGPNGAGKTTTIKMLSTLLRPTSGDALIEGYSVTRDPGRVRRVIGLVPQDLTADDEMTGWDNVYIQARLYGLSAGEARRRTREVLEELDLLDAARRKVATYSGGMRRRLEIAMSLVHEPSVLFLDEPTLGLDVQSRRTLWRHIENLKRRGVTIILTTHYMEEAERLSDRVAIIHRGRIVATGSPDELKSRVQGDTVYIEPADPAILQGLLESLKAAGFNASIVNGSVAVTVSKAENILPAIAKVISGFEVKSISIAKPTLEEVFIRLTGERLAGGEERVDTFKFRRMVRRIRG